MYELTDNYGSLSRGFVVEAAEVGYDWVRVVHRGSSLYIPLNFLKRVNEYTKIDFDLCTLANIFDYYARENRT